MERSRLPSVETSDPVTLPAQNQAITDEENDRLAAALSQLSAKQFKACRLDAAGIDSATVAQFVGVVPQTVALWRRNPVYLEVRGIFISIINRSGIQFRQDCQRLVLAPAYAELIKRMWNIRYVDNIELRDLLGVIRVVGKETRLDQAVGGLTENDDDLQDLMERRKNFSHASQAQAISDLLSDGKIIAFPVRNNGIRSNALSNVG